MEASCSKTCRACSVMAAKAVMGALTFEDAFQSILLLHTLKPEKTGAKLSSSQIPSVVIKIVWVCAEQAS